MTYKVINESTSAHCCFTHTVIDTTKPVYDGDGDHMEIGREYRYEPVCETFSEEDAVKVCTALNEVRP